MNGALYLAPFVVSQIRESLTMTIYLRRNGAMMFWRVGKLGGSFYLANASREDKSAKAMRRAKRANMRRELTFYRRVGAALYRESMV
jgi:hypothetical protein